MTIEVYAVYLTVSTSDHPVGYVVNNIIGDGPDIDLPAGQAAIADPDRAYPIGATYVAPPASS